MNDARGICSERGRWMKAYLLQMICPKETHEARGEYNGQCRGWLYTSKGSIWELEFLSNFLLEGYKLALKMWQAQTTAAMQSIILTFTYLGIIVPLCMKFFHEMYAKKRISPHLGICDNKVPLYHPFIWIGSELLIYCVLSGNIR